MHHVRCAHVPTSDLDSHLMPDRYPFYNDVCLEWECVAARSASIACLAEQSSTIWWRKGAINITGTGCTHFCSGSLEDKHSVQHFWNTAVFGKDARKDISFLAGITRVSSCETQRSEFGERELNAAQPRWASPTFEPVDSVHSDQNNHTKNVNSTGEDFVFSLSGRIHLCGYHYVLFETKCSWTVQLKIYFSCRLIILENASQIKGVVHPQIKCMASLLTYPLVQNVTFSFLLKNVVFSILSEWGLEL